MDLPKHIWKNGVLPEMGARMGIHDSTYDPFKGLPFDEQNAIIQTGIYPDNPILPLKDWNLLKNYILSMAPDSLAPSPKAPNSSVKEIIQFMPKPINIDNREGTFITFLKYDELDKTILSADLNGKMQKYDFIEGKSKILMRTGTAITSYTEKDNLTYLTSVGYLNPSEIARGSIQIGNGDTLERLPFILHRPVSTLVHDLDKSGQNELIVGEYGDLTGSLSLIRKNENQEYQKEILLNIPGTIRIIAKDMNGDGKDDLIALTAQGNESITILYQQENLKFIADQVIRFSPVYGNSWFELIDYDGDGYDDIITVNGDNADKSYVQKPYHGMRIYINNGKNKFEEKYFYAMNGATRVVARDFDNDGDIDFGLLSAFPDYNLKPAYSFMYLENENTLNFHFEPYTFKESELGRWLLMDAGDVDNDGDEDIILSSFTYVITPVPKNISKIWKESNVDLMILENKLINLNRGNQPTK